MDEDIPFRPRRLPPPDPPPYEPVPTDPVEAEMAAQAEVIRHLPHAGVTPEDE